MTTITITYIFSEPTKKILLCALGVIILCFETNVPLVSFPVSAIFHFQLALTMRRKTTRCNVTVDLNYCDFCVVT